MPRKTTNDECFETTVAELANRTGIPSGQLSAFLKTLVQVGIAEKVGERKPEGGRGKPAHVFRVPASIYADQVGQRYRFCLLTGESSNEVIR